MMTPTRKLAILAALLALPVLPATAGAPGPAGDSRVPPGFISVSPQTQSPADFEMMAQLGLKNVRLPLYWFGIDRRDPRRARPTWTDFDGSVALAAKNNMRVFPFVWGSPPWVARGEGIEPVASARQRRAWASFLKRSVRRYGPDGSFWRANRDLPYLPIREWEIWNEPNIVTFSSASDPERFARLLRISGRAIHSVHPGARVVIGGLFGRPLQIPPNVGSGEFLDRIYRTGGDIKRHIQGVGLHPYVAQASAIGPQIRNLRRIMRKHRDAGTRLYISELGWGSEGNRTRWERGWRGQARELNRAFSMLARHRHAWRIAGIWWFSWADVREGCLFCPSAGLLTEEREAKPSWYRFASWVRGDPSIVPRARLRR